MLPFLLHSQKRLAVSRRNRLGYVRKGLPQLFAGVCYQRLQRPLVFHGDHAAFDSAPQQFARQLPPLLLIQTALNIPAPRLRLDIRE